jgi:hypothetical protein
MRWAALFAGALVVRLIYIAEWKGTALATALVGDGRQYDLWARGIAAGDWIGGQVFYQAPLYPYACSARSPACCWPSPAAASSPTVSA